MTNKNINMRTKASIHLKPAGKDYLWSDNHLNDDFAENIDMNPLAEVGNVYVMKQVLV